MTGEQRALYLMLLVIQWAGGPLPEDINEIAQLVGYNEKTFKRLWPRIAPKFKKFDDSGLMNLTLEEIRADSAKKHKVNSDRAAAAAAARWGTAKSTGKAKLRVLHGGKPEQCSEHSVEHCLSNARAMPSQIPDPTEVREEGFQGGEV